MISINDVTLSFGSKALLDGISFHIGEEEKIGLTGKNGAGKSTLMKLITGEQKPSSGTISKPSDLTIGYLPQIMSHNKGRSVIDEVLTVFDHIHVLQAQLDSLTDELSAREDYESAGYAALLDRIDAINARLSLESGESPLARASKVLKGLGFKEEEFQRETQTFSQGWNMRIELAKLLLSNPGILLLDEPTNHLDIESIQWFEDYLKAFKGAVLLVSHDRRFLDSVTTRTVEIMLGHIHDYKVPYSKYLELREERIQQQLSAWRNQQKMIQETQDFINRFRYKPTKSNQVQSRIKALEKLEIIEVDQTDSSRINLRFPPASRTSDLVFKATDLTAGYPGKTVFTGADIEVKRGEKIAFLGRNGEGKTTLMRIIMHELEPLAGKVYWGNNVNIGYYAQNQEDILDPAETVLGTLDRVAVGEVRTSLKDILGAFLFKGDDVDKRVSVLSGGERARLGMAKLMLSPYNVLALDEPTNHMDIQSKDRLKEALKRYDGTVIMVSHDRDFLEGLADKVYEFHDGRVREHLGGMEDYLRSLKPEAPAEDNTPVKKAESGASAQYRQSKYRSKESRKLQNRIDFLEKEIVKKEQEMKNIEKILANPTENDDIFELTRQYLECKIVLDRQTEEWTALMEKAEE